MKKEEERIPSHEKRREHTMSKKTKAKNVAQIAKGRMKETAGVAVGDDSLEAEGRKEQAKGHMKQAVEHMKDAIKK
jgi:uncharacterized protein YjbJ (UPF0337 family)